MKVRLTLAAATAALLGSVALYPLFVGARWVMPGLGAVVVVSAAGLLTRRFRIPAPLSLPACLLALQLYVTALYTGPEALAGIIPTPGSLTRMADLMGEGWHVAGRYAAPVPLRPGVAVLSTLCIGLVAAVVDFVAVRLRHAAAAGLPLLAMYSVPAAIREESVSWVAFLLGAVGFMSLLLADAREQVSGWGRAVPSRRWSADPSAGRPGSSGPAGAGYRVGLAAVAIAVLVPTVVPGIRDTGMFGMGGVGGQGNGGQMVTTPDPLVSLKRELTRRGDAVVLNYRTNDPEQPDYLRMYSLDRFDGERWTYSALQSTAKDRVRDRMLPTAPGLSTAQAQRVITQVKVDRRVRDMTFLPMPYPPVRVTMKGDWRVHAASLMVYSLRDAAAGRTYTVQSLRVRPTPEQLAAASDRAPADITRRYLAIPGEVPEQIRELAMAKSKGASSPFEKAVKLQRWFTESGEFTYDLSKQSPRHVSDLVDFLTSTKRGYCEQFAAAMALLARTLGIPARVAMGYTAGTRIGDGSWEVRSRDAHAWPELYFEGAGWVRFEPTPAGGLGQGTASVPAYTQPEPAGAQPGQIGDTSPAPAGSAGGASGASPAAAPGHRTDELDRLARTGLPRSSGGGAFGPVFATALLLLLMILMAPMAVRIISRRRRWAHTGDAAGVANAAWTQLRSDAIDHAVPWRASETPRTTVRRLAEHLRAGTAVADSLTRIAEAEERARYSRSPASPQSLRADSETVREAFARSVPARTRWRARLAPPSAMMTFRNAARRAPEILDRTGRLLAARPLRMRRAARSGRAGARGR